MAHLFGVQRSTVCIIVYEMCKAIVETMMEKYIKMPSGDDMKVLDGIEDKWGFPQCVGAIGGSHIPISAPELNHRLLQQEGVVLDGSTSYCRP